MDCNEGSQVVTIIQGEDRDLFLRIVDKATNQPFDLTNASAVNARFKNADGTVLTKILGGGVSIVSALSGKITVSVYSPESILLKAREAQDFEIEIVLGLGGTARLTVVQFLAALTVRARVV